MPAIRDRTPATWLERRCAPCFHHALLLQRAEARRCGARAPALDGSAARGLSRHHAEFLAGFSLVLGRVRPRAPEKDLDPDRDGFLDPNDKCPKLAGVAPDGCPAIDSDGDTFLDNVDKCPYEAGVAPDGCPPPDKDKDGFLDPDDKCPEEPGIAPDGCPPPPDSDGDGIIDKDDDCPLVPEVYNGYKDKDGCPDELPKEIKYDGRPIEGIFFEFNKDKIQKKSFKTLDEAIVVLKSFEDIRIEISGHTDDVGSEEANLDLSKRRAESVKRYMVEKGIDASRIETVGYGRSKPIDTGKSAKARAKNRRIEFRVIVVDKPGAVQTEIRAGHLAFPRTHPDHLVMDQVVKIRFDASVDQNMPWSFKPVVRTMDLRIGETGLAFYEAHNPTDRVIAGKVYIPGGGTLEQSDGTAWMAFYSQNMLELAVALSEQDPAYEGFIVKFVHQALKDRKDAEAYRKLQSRNARTAQTVAEAPQVARPGAAVSRTAVAETRVRDLQKQAAKTGRLDTVAALIAAKTARK